SFLVKNERNKRMLTQTFSICHDREDLIERRKKMKNNKVFYGWWLVLFSALSLAVMGPASVAVANLFQNPVTHEFGITNSQFAISNSLVLGMGIFLSPFISKKLAFGN